MPPGLHASTYNDSTAFHSVAVHLINLIRLRDTILRCQLHDADVQVVCAPAAIRLVPHNPSIDLASFPKARVGNAHCTTGKHGPFSWVQRCKVQSTAAILQCFRLSQAAQTPGQAHCTGATPPLRPLRMLRQPASP